MTLGKFFGGRLVCEKGLRNIITSVSGLYLIINGTTTYTTRNGDETRGCKMTSSFYDFLDLLSEMNSFKKSNELTSELAGLLRGLSIFYTLSKFT